MARGVKCIYCGQWLDRDLEDFVQVKERYAHKTCFQKEEDKKFIIAKIHEKMSGLFGTNYSKVRIDRQIKELLNDGKSEIGILQALEYWYDEKNNDPTLAKGGIRIVGFIYGESQDYWCNKEKNKSLNLNADIEKCFNPPTRTVIVKSQPLQKPTRLKLFDIK